MGLDLVLVPCSSCCILTFQIVFFLCALGTWLGGNTYCADTYPQDTDGAFSIKSAAGCVDDTRCEILYNGQEFIPSGDFNCRADEDCQCDGILFEDPVFTIVVVMGFFLAIKLLIELYLIWCANYLCSNQFKSQSKKILRVSESIWIRCVQCRAPASWQAIMDAYDSGHFYAFRERVFYLSTFINIVFVIITIVGFVDMLVSVPGIAIFYIIGAVLILVLMCFSCFVKWKYKQWASSPDEEDEFATR